MKIDRVNEFVLIDKNNSKFRIENKGDYWHFVIVDDIDNVFSGVSTFSFKGNNNQVIADLVANLFNEISKSRDVKELYIGYENR
jgi:hypothetical protein